MISAESGDWEGLDGFTDEILQEMRPKAENLVKDALVFFEGSVKTKLTGSRSGRSYQVSRTGALHVASAPGEPPASLYGNLRNSIGHRGPEWDGWTVEGEVGPGLGTRPAGPNAQDPESYARRLEWGGISIVPRDVRVQVAPGEWRVVKAGTIIRILPRPYLQPTEDEVRPVIERMFEDGI